MTTSSSAVPQSHGGAFCLCSHRQIKEDKSANDLVRFGPTEPKLLPFPPEQPRPCFPAAFLLNKRLPSLFAANILTPLDSDSRGINFN